MKELIFSAGRVEMECFHFCNKKKEHNFQTDEYIALLLFKRKKTKALFIWLIQVFYGLLYPLPKYL